MRKGERCPTRTGERSVNAVTDCRSAALSVMLSKRQKKEEVSREYEVTERKCSVPLKGSKFLRFIYR